MIIPKFLDKARNLAKKSILKNYRVGSVIARGTFIIACGRNRPFDNEIPQESGRSIHAEIDALSKKRANPDDAVAYIVVLTQNRHDGLGKPCDECRNALQEQGIGTLVYSNRGTVVIEKL